MLHHSYLRSIARPAIHSHPKTVMRYPTRAFQSDTTVVSNDRYRRHQASRKESRRALTGAAFTYLLD